MPPSQHGPCFAEASLCTYIVVISITTIAMSILSVGAYHAAGVVLPYLCRWSDMRHPWVWRIALRCRGIVEFRVVEVGVTKDYDSHARVPRSACINGGYTLLEMWSDVRKRV